MGVWVDGQYAVLQEKGNKRAPLTQSAAVPEDVEKIVIGVGKMRSGCAGSSLGEVARAAVVLGMRWCSVRHIFIASVRTAPSTWRQLIVSKSAAVP